MDTASSLDIGAEKNAGNNSEYSNPRYTITVATIATTITISIFLSTIFN
jgi:hypothetical protein